MGYNILIVDDMLINRKLMKSVLNNLDDIVFFEASNGVEALNVLKEHEVDLLILDLLMPVKDGFEVLEELRKDNSYPALPIIVNSALDEIGTIQKALELGAYDYFAKPLTPQQMKVNLPLKVRNALRSYEQHKELEKITKQMKEELELSSVLQQTLVSHRLPIETAEIHTIYQPFMRIGGDFFACEQVGDKLWVIIADVSGHGVASAMISSMIKVEFSNKIRYLDSPKEILEAMNMEFSKMLDGKYYFTTFVALIDDNRLTFANAGQPYPLVFRNNGSIDTLKQNGFPIGMFDSVSYDHCTVPVASGDVLMLYTDGVVDSLLYNDNPCTQKEIMTYLEQHKELVLSQPEKFIQISEGLLLDKISEQAKDDLALMLVKFL